MSATQLHKGEGPFAEQALRNVRESVQADHDSLASSRDKVAVDAEEPASLDDILSFLKSSGNAKVIGQESVEDEEEELPGPGAEEGDSNADSDCSEDDADHRGCLGLFAGLLASHGLRPGQRAAG